MLYLDAFIKSSWKIICQDQIKFFKPLNCNLLKSFFKLYLMYSILGCFLGWEMGVGC